MTSNDEIDFHINNKVPSNKADINNWRSNVKYSENPKTAASNNTRDKINENNDHTDGETASLPHGISNATEEQANAQFQLL